jgi:glucose/arabinose dehydrogenase/PKD repeat protein
MLKRPTRSGVLLLATVALAYACGNTSTPQPGNSSGGSAGNNNAPGSGNNPGGAVNGGNNAMAGSPAPSGGTSGAGGSSQGGTGGDPVPVYEQDDPNLVPEESDFERVRIPVSVSNAMQIDVDENENVYVLERDGVLRVWKTATDEVVDVGALDTFSGNEDGALGFALDPNFATNHWVYIYYSSGTAMEQKLSRFDLHSDTLHLDTEKVLLTVPDDREVMWHVSGGLAFDSKGNLYLSLGDNTNPFESDGYSPHDEGAGRVLYDAQRTAANSKELRGKILRITPAADGTYTIPEGNLWTAAEGRPEVYTAGNRNPWRIAIDPANDWLYWGEVGPDAPENGDQLDARGPRGYDEFNQAKAAGFFGWPYCIADNKPYVDYNFQAETSGAKFNCAAPTNNSPNNTGVTTLPASQPSWISYSYGSGQYPELGTTGGRTAVMGAVYRWKAGGSINKMPRHYDGSKFIMEYTRGWINEVRTDAEGTVESVQPFMPGLTWKELSSMRVSANGVMYIAQYGTESTVYRLNYVGMNNQQPVVVASVDKDSGPAPLTVAFSSAGSSDPEGQPLSFAWDFQSDGTVDSTEPNPSFTFTTAGSYDVKLTVSDGAASNGSASTTLTIAAGNTRPVVTISSPPAGGFIAMGQQVAYTVSVTDAEDGSTPDTIPCSSVTATAALGHDIHEHDGMPTPGCSGSFTAATGLISTENTWQVLNVSYKDQGAGALSLLGTAKLKLHFKRIEAEHYERQGEANDVQLESTTDVGSGLSVAYINHGSYLCWNEMNFQGIDEITYRVASGGTGGRIELRQDSPTGTLVAGATAQVASTGGWQTWTNVSVPLTGASGTHKYCFVFARNAGDELLFNLNWLEFGGPGVGN